jgi:hypothetical protein
MKLGIRRNESAVIASRLGAMRETRRSPNSLRVAQRKMAPETPEPFNNLVV